MATFSSLTTAQLKQAVQLREQIETAQQKLDALLGAPASAVTPKRKLARAKGKRTLSAATREKMRAAQQARWTKVKGASVKRVAKKKVGLTPEGKARIGAVMKARWAAKKKAAATAA